MNDARPPHYNLPAARMEPGVRRASGSEIPRAIPRPSAPAVSESSQVMFVEARAAWWRRVMSEAFAGARLLCNVALFLTVIGFCMAALKSPQEMTPAALDQTLTGTARPVVLYFWQRHSTGCERMEPMIADAERANRDLKVIRINALTSPGIADQYAIRGTPTFVLVQRGRVMNRHDGPFAEAHEFRGFLQASMSR